jgi:hypothetical protein
MAIARKGTETGLQVRACRFECCLPPESRHKKEGPEYQPLSGPVPGLGFSDSL